MNRLSLVIAGLAVGAMTLGGGVSAQESPSETIVNGGYSVADPTNPIVAAEGEERTYGDIATGNSGGEVVGDPAALANIQSHESIIASVPPPDLTPDDDPAPIPSSGSAPAPADSATTTETPPSDSTLTSGEPASTGGEPAPTTTEAVPVTDGGTTAAPSFCDGYAGWYEAQVAYEAAGGVNGDPGVVQAADADYDGVACEHLITY